MRYLSLGLVSGIVLAASSAGAQLPPPYYVGGGVRGGFNDPTSAVINAKVQVSEFNAVSLSVRPEVFLGDITEFRLPITVETMLFDGVYPYLGGGIAVNTDGLNAVDPMVTVGADALVSDHVVLKAEFNVIFQTGINDTDLEFVSTLNYAF